MGQTFEVEVADEKITVPEGTPLLELAKKYQDRYENDIVLALYNNRLRELNKTVKADGELIFITTGDKIGQMAYRRSVTLLLQRAVHNLWGRDGISVKVFFSISKGYYCELRQGAPIVDGKAVCEEGRHPEKKLVHMEQDMLLKLKIEMMRLVDLDIVFEKDSINTEEAVALFTDLDMEDKEKLFKYRRSSRVNIYELGNYKDYYYGYMVPSTGYLKYFDLTLLEDGFVLLYPGTKANIIEEFKPSMKLFHTMKDSKEWGEMLGMGTVGSLNDKIASGDMEQMILTQEALMEERIGKLAEQIAQSHNKKFIMIAGPSSSGKTTFSHRLSIQLAAKGLKPHPFPLDDYYTDRELAPRDENGELDLEALEALDVELFNHDMNELLQGKRVELPTFNFKTGKREYKGKNMQLGPDDVLVIEGIHGLNDRLSYSLPAESKFKIYISALTQLNIDEHNCLPTTDGRLIRRIVRDARTRGTSAQETIAMWDSVRRGEEKNIFPFQEGADVMFNSALIYELAVLKTYAEPLLFGISHDAPEYVEAKRLLKFLDYFLPMPSDGISKNSIIREFIGGSCFNV